MKNLLFFALLITSQVAMSEASFTEVEKLIQQKQYVAAESLLEGIIHNHPQSAKAYYAMSQAQSGLGNAEKATYAMNRAKELDPLMNMGQSTTSTQFMPTAANTNEHSSFGLFTVLFMMIAFGIGYWVSTRKKKIVNETAHPVIYEDYSMKHTDYSPTKSSYSGPRYPSYSAGMAPPSPTVVNNVSGSGNHDMLTGLLIGEMISDHGHSSNNDHTTIIEREVVREPSKSISPSLDNGSSSSWDSGSSSSSSWDSGSSSSSSWDSGSSSSSSWDSGSSSDSNSSDSSW